jgi:hypothetical protein
MDLLYMKVVLLKSMERFAIKNAVLLSSDGHLPLAIYFS